MDYLLLNRLSFASKFCVSSISGMMNAEKEWKILLAGCRWDDSQRTIVFLASCDDGIGR